MPGSGGECWEALALTKPDRLQTGSESAVLLPMTSSSPPPAEGTYQHKEHIGRTSRNWKRYWSRRAIDRSRPRFEKFADEKVGSKSIAMMMEFIAHGPALV